MLVQTDLAKENEGKLRSKKTMRERAEKYEKEKDLEMKRITKRKRNQRNEREVKFKMN